jgi:hypothetical protein
MSFWDQIDKMLPLSEVYKDLLQPATRELGEGIESIAKTARFLIAPFEYTGVLHDKYIKFLNKITEKIQEQELVEVHPKITGTALEGIRFLDDESLLFEMFVNLLSTALKKETASTAHPAFARIIDQLSPDEAYMLYKFKKESYEYWTQSTLNPTDNRFYGNRIIRNDFPVDELTYPNNYTMYINHLNNMQIAGVPEYRNQEPIFTNGQQTGVKIFRHTSFLDFGRLFADCCVPDEIVKPENNTT